MASVRCLTQGKKDTVNIYVQFSISRTQVYKRKTGFVIDLKQWSDDKAEPKQNIQELKKLKSKLDKLKTFILDNFNESVSSGAEITGDWLQLQIDLFNKKVQLIELDILTNYIQKYIDDAPLKKNGKKGTGLSKGRVQNLKLFKNTIKRYEAEELKSKNILIKEVNLSFAEHYKSWLLSQKYSINYVGKNLANLKTICLDALKNDIEISTQLKNIKSISEQKEPEDIIYLNEQEQEEIKKAPLIREALINVRLSNRSKRWRPTEHYRKKHNTVKRH